MPPRRYIALIPSLLFLLGLLILVQQNHLPFTSALAQSAPDDLPIDLIASNNSPQMAGFTVTLTATVASGNSAGLAYTWNFGDGQTAQGRVVQHTYAAEGSYSAFVIASNGIDSKRAATLVTVWPFHIPTPTPGPIEGLKATSDSPVIAGNPVTFLGTVVRGTNVIYTWNFGDGSPPTNGPSVSHVYPTPGYYLVTLRGTNELGSEVTTIQVEITDAPPKGLRIAHTNPLAVNSASFFTATVESGTNVQYQWSMSDGKLFNGPQFIHIFEQTVTLEVRVRAWNSVGEISASEIIKVQDQPPVLIRILDSGAQPINQPIEFSAKIQSKSPVITYWQWGDGQVSEVRSGFEQNALPIKEINVSHPYELPDRHIVTLVIYNLGGSITHEFVAYAGTSKPLQSIAINWTPAMPVFGNPITFSATYGQPLDKCTWDFDDGMIKEGGPVITHTYTLADNYVVHSRCSTIENPQLVEADRIIHIGTTLFMPILASNGAFVNAAPTGAPTVVPTESTEELNREPTASATLTATATPTLLPPVASTPTPTEIATLVPATPTIVPTLVPTPVETPTELPSATPTPTPTEIFEPGGTIPQPTPLPTETTLGGTIPQPPPP